MGWQDDKRREIQAIMKARVIDTVYHITQIENLASIMEYGIQPRARLDEHGVPYLFTDSWRNDGELGATSVMIGTWASYMIESKRRTMPGARWAVLAIDASILWDMPCRFCRTNAAGNEVLHANARLLERSDALEAMFEDAPPYGRPFEGPSWRKHMGLSPTIPTRHDAEVLVFGGVDPIMIHGVAVEKEWHVPMVQEALRYREGAALDIEVVDNLT